MVGSGRRCAILVGVGGGGGGGEGRRHGSDVLSRGARVETEGKVRRGEARRGESVELWRERRETER